MSKKKWMKHTNIENEVFQVLCSLASGHLPSAVSAAKRFLEVLEAADEIPPIQLRTISGEVDGMPGHERYYALGMGRQS